MVMAKTFWVSAVLAMLFVMASYSDFGFTPMSDFSNAALEMTGMTVESGGASMMIMGMMTQYLILLGVFYFFLRSVAKSFKS